MKILFLSLLLALTSPAILVQGQQKNPNCSESFDRIFQRIGNDKLIAYEIKSDYFLELRFKNPRRVERYSGKEA